MLPKWKEWRLHSEQIRLAESTAAEKSLIQESNRLLAEAVAVNEVCKTETQNSANAKYILENYDKDEVYWLRETTIC